MNDAKNGSRASAVHPLVSRRRHSGLREPTALVNFEPPASGAQLPIMCRPVTPGLDLAAWARENRADIEAKLLRNGAVLFRDFDLRDIEDVNDCVAAISGEALEYRFRASPRTQVDPRFFFYTSTDYPADQRIFPHNEHAYSPTFPLQLFFFCMTPASSGGETPIGDARRLAKEIAPEVRDQFTRKGVQYVRNYGDGFGLPWQTVFQTTDRAVVEEYCKKQGISVEWKSGDRLRTRQVGSVWFRHPISGEPVWFNHATFFHGLTLPPNVRDGFLKEFGEQDLPQNTFYGDGSSIERDVILHLQQAYRRVMVEFSWKRGDVLLLDNVLTLHARNEFTGERRIVVAMAKPQSRVPNRAELDER